MRYQIFLFFLMAFLANESGVAIYWQDSGIIKQDPAFTFANVKYFHRFTNKDQHEYTPANQTDLNAWKDMVTIHYYRTVRDEDTLAAAAGAVLQNYKAANGLIIKTDSIPKTQDKPAEYFIVAILGQPDFLEAVFARFRMHKGVGSAVIYSHRIYGNKIGNEMSAWLRENGPDIEISLLKWDAMPKSTKEIIILVDHYRPPCVDPKPKLCYLVAKADNPLEYPYFYGEIEGFKYQWGHEYKLRVTDELYNYRLIEVMSDRKKPAKSSFRIPLKLPLNSPFFSIDDSSNVILIGGLKISFSNQKLKTQLIKLHQAAGPEDSISGDFMHVQSKTENVIMLTKINYEKR